MWGSSNLPNRLPREQATASNRNGPVCIATPFDRGKGIVVKPPVSPGALAFGQFALRRFGIRLGTRRRRELCRGNNGGLHLLAMVQERG